MRLIKVLLLIPILTYGIAIGSLWYEVKTNADEIISAAAPFAKISYDSVYTSPMGNEVGLNNIIIQPVMAQDEFRIEQLRFTVPHIGYFLDAGKSFKKKTLPENIGMAINRVHFDIDGEVFNLIENMQKQAAASAQSENMFLANVDTLGCGELDEFMISDYREMGIGAVVMSSTINIGYDEKSNRTHISVNATADNLYDIDLGAEFDMKPNAMSSRMAAKGIPANTKATINYRDTGYYKLRNNYCAELNNGSIDEYIEGHSQLLSAKLGAAFPDEILAAYQKFLHKGGSFTAKINPPNDLTLDGIQFYKPSDIIMMLGLSVSINQTRLVTEEIKWGVIDKKPINNTTTKIKEPIARSKARLAVEDSEKRRSRPSYQLIKISDAKKYLGKMVEVTTHEGKVRKGLLREVSDEYLYLVIKLGSGSLDYPAERDRINMVRVLR